MKIIKLFLITVALTLSYNLDISAKRVKNSFSISKSNSKKKEIKEKFSGIGISLIDSISIASSGIEGIERVHFSGYEKEANSNMESFILTNTTDRDIFGFEVRIDYMDMQDRMLHSRVLKEELRVPPKESRHVDIKTWDSQHTYYYYLGNEPKRVATPFQVSFKPQRYWIIE